MAIYEYEHEPPEGTSCPLRFETFQPMSAEALKTCPTCGKPVRRVFSAVQVQTHGRDGLLSRSNLEAHGFTQFTRKGKGYYEKTAGVGPAGIASDE